MFQKPLLTSYMLIAILSGGCKSTEGSNAALESKDTSDNNSQFWTRSSNKDVKDCIDKKSDDAVKYAEKHGYKDCKEDFKNLTRMYRDGMIQYTLDCKKAMPDVRYPTTYPRGCKDDDKKPSIYLDEQHED